MKAGRALPIFSVGALLLGLCAVVAPAVTEASTAAAASITVPDGFTLNQVKTGFQQPHALHFAPDGRLFLLEQVGRVDIIDHGTVTTALHLGTDELVPPGGSAGLLSISFPPNFKKAKHKHLYLIYTHQPMAGYDYPHNVLTRWLIKGNTIVPSSEQILVHFDSLIGTDGVLKTMHYGGDMDFGPDGKLYVTTGDLLNGTNAQSLQNLYGKILRYNPDGSIPKDNPYYNTVNGRLRAIWAIGVRNPFKIAYDKGNGDMMFGDVGADTWEEVNSLPPSSPGVNFGWSNTEGYTQDPAYRSPLLAYPHDEARAAPGAPWGCAVMGGDVYWPKQETFPASYQGQYFFADNCNGWVRSIDPDSGVVGPELVSGLESPVDMAVGPKGSLWIITRVLNGANNGVLWRLQYTGLGDTAPTISGQPQDLTVGDGQDATFSAFASGPEPLSYQWYRDGTPIDGATDSTVTLPAVGLADDGAQISVEVTNSFGTTASNAATLTVLDDEPPVPTINSPKINAHFAGGDVIKISGTATDPEDGPLPASAFEWYLLLHHNTHTHPELGPIDGKTKLKYTVPHVFETDPDIWLRIHLIVTDSEGVKTEVTRDVLPKMSSLSFDTVPAGNAVILDGQPASTPLTIDAVQGITRTLSAPPTTIDGVDMVLDSWEDGSTAPTRSFYTPAGDHLYRLFYRPADGVVGSGTGLTAKYYSQPDFTSQVSKQVDRVPYFTWGEGPPVAGAPDDNFSALWTGNVESQFSEDYTFSVDLGGTDAVKVVVDGTTLINTLNNGHTGVVSGTIPLTAGTPVPIRVSFRGGAGSSAMPLMWSSASTPLSAIPGSQLAP
jgi:glucose/arabinose dehydrogenase